MGGADGAQHADPEGGFDPANGSFGFPS